MSKSDTLQAELKKLQQEEHELIQTISVTESKISESQKEISKANTIQRSIEEISIRVSQLKSNKTKLDKLSEDINVRLEGIDIESLQKKLDVVLAEEDILKKDIDASEVELDKKRKESEAVVALQNRIRQQLEKNEGLRRRHSAIANQLSKGNEHSKS